MYGNYLAFVDDHTCIREDPMLSTTMVSTLFFGWVQLVFFFIMIGGIIVWAMAKLCGR